MTDAAPAYDRSLHHNMDAAAWAAEFKRLFPDSDEGLMLGWFANAIMAGYDVAMNRAEKIMTVVDRLDRAEAREQTAALRAALVGCLQVMEHGYDDDAVAAMCQRARALLAAPEGTPRA
jgi:hypothetical protein